MRAATLLAPSSAIISRAVEAQRRLDERLPLAGKAHRRHPADHRQCDELLQGCGRRAVASELRRRRTLFHEFGHGLHGLLSNVTYPLLAGTAVSTDFVELPRSSTSTGSQPDILRRYATHYRTGEAIPKNCSSA